MGQYKKYAYLQTYKDVKINVQADSGMFYCPSIAGISGITLDEVKNKIDVHLRKIEGYREIEAIVPNFVHRGPTVVKLTPLRNVNDWYNNDASRYTCLINVGEEKQEEAYYFCRADGGNPKGHASEEVLKVTKENLRRLDAIIAVNVRIEKNEEEFVANRKAMDKEIEEIMDKMDRWTVGEIEIKKGEA